FRRYRRGARIPTSSRRGNRRSCRAPFGRRARAKLIAAGFRAEIDPSGAVEQRYRMFGHDERSTDRVADHLDSAGGGTSAARRPAHALDETLQKAPERPQDERRQNEQE